MGKCLSRFENLGTASNDLKLEPGAFKELTEPTVLLHPVAAATNEMGVSGSTSRNQPAMSSLGNSANRFQGGAEHSDKIACDTAALSFASPVTRATRVDDKVSNEQVALDKCIRELFNRYRDVETDCIVADGIESFCSDIGVAPDDFRVLVLAWKFKAETMCRFTREEFTQGCRALGDAHSPEAIGARLPGLAAEVVDSREQFRDLYRWTYRFGLDVGQRTLPLAMAVSLWRLVFSQRPPSVLERWLAFLERRSSGTSGIIRDTWDMFLPFTEVIGNDLERYDESEAWPSLIDDFVEYENDKKNHNVAAASISSGDLY